jgi:hypothetical protein
VRVDLSKGAIVEFGEVLQHSNYQVTIRGPEIREWRGGGRKKCGGPAIAIEAWLFPR